MTSRKKMMTVLAQINHGTQVLKTLREIHKLLLHPRRLTAISSDKEQKKQKRRPSRMMLPLKSKRADWRQC